ncbi:DUF5995 family protein [Streptomyces fulvorobeus]|uniref:Uncharacterized protein n=1 Tax=Streptomyces fulvorobeus TaxID=284028 RepID=A0A7Y9H8A3_9ACTN|nr:DUF5995 family protein [Streptomyces fulvorobeus]NYE39707.1 hypothetical protein [Streptomyces fulvorobeus]
MAQSEQYADLAGPGTATLDVPAVIGRLRAFRSGWPPHDGVAVFHDAYLTVSEKAGRRTPETLDALLAGRYLAAVDTAAAGLRPAACWRPLFRYRRHPGVRPAQFALAGINAHVGNDLALAVVDACHALGCAPPDLEDAFERAGDLLAMVRERVLEELEAGPGLPEVTDPLTHLLESWSLERAREAAWSAAGVLWELRGAPRLAGEFRERMDAGTGLVGRCLLTPCR